MGNNSSVTDIEDSCNACYMTLIKLKMNLNPTEYSKLLNDLTLRQLPKIRDSAIELMKIESKHRGKVREILKILSEDELVELVKTEGKCKDLNKCIKEAIEHVNKICYFVTEIKEAHLKEQQIKEQQVREQQIREQIIKETQLKEIQIREQMMKEAQLREQQLREQQQREQQIKEQLREVQLRESQLRESQLREQKLKETQNKEPATEIKPANQ